MRTFAGSNRVDAHTLQRLYHIFVHLVLPLHDNPKKMSGGKWRSSVVLWMTGSWNPFLPSAATIKKTLT
jgi:hypothetical protein